ncbi:tRNA-dependent cyclodipeptide synthase [Spartinivicinus poritis]|uniref:Cyclodipeptide synthase n=1 Tax=Spartinivicinus poritis TaxID=2994640 RepID=A0ABT5U9P5_9GAMM|nr:tRNA-dependent cyclodipeptide synthase [Spartinivicinus sp. A2-2]MDE1462900.1 tRNA-dependent cyclodipeptide synthase [Spartinivicinus sp. A2-2]
MNEVDQLKKIFDHHQTKYITINFSQFCSESELQLLSDLKYIKLVKVSLVQLSGALKLLVYPEGNSLCIDKIKSSLKCTSVEIVSNAEIKKCFPSIKSTTLLPFGDLYGTETFVDQALIRAKKIAFFSKNKDELIVLNYDDYSKIIKPEYNNISNKSLMAIKSFVAPKEKRNYLNKYKKCFFGVSLQNENFSDDKRLAASLDWISNNFEYCEVLVGDYIHRLTLQIIDCSLDDNDSYDKALQLGREFVSDKIELFAKYSSSCQFEIKYMSEYHRDSCYSHHRKNFLEFIECNQHYNHILTKFANTFVQRLINTKSLSLTDKERGVALSRKYLIDEGAIFSQAVSKGYNVLVYPGSIDPFIHISEGNYRYAPKLLKEMVCVGLSLKHIK